MHRFNFTLDENTVLLLNDIAEKFYNNNKSQTIRAALESLATHIGHEGWVVSGYSPVLLQEGVACHSCHETYNKGNVLYRPVFERGAGVNAMPSLPSQLWLDCAECVEKH